MLISTKKLQGRYNTSVGRVAQSVQWLATDWTVGVRYPAEAEDFSSNLCAQPPARRVPGTFQEVNEAGACC
jgi:hypothetical protein